MGQAQNLGQLVLSNALIGLPSKCYKRVTEAISAQETV